MIQEMGRNIFIAENIHYEGDLTIGHCSAIGLGATTPNIKIGKYLKIGSFCLIDNNVTIGDYCVIEDGCYIYKNTIIGNEVRILNGSRIFGKTKIGDRSIINGSVSQRVIIEEDVRFFGRIAHSHRDHTLDWKTTVEPSPVFRKACIVGINALIIGDVEIGENSYIAAGETVRCDVPANSVFFKGEIHDKRKFRGLII
jgi:acetyltransferase-like isoleucine patch superfamily enzyme